MAVGEVRLRLFGRVRQSTTLHQALREVLTAAQPLAQEAQAGLDGVFSWFPGPVPRVALATTSGLDRPSPALSLTRQANAQDKPQVVNLLSEPRASFASRSAFLARQVTHLIFMPLALPVGLRGAVAFELKTNPEDPRVDDRLAPLAVDLAELVEPIGPLLALLPCPNEPPGDHGLPVVGAKLRPLLSRLRSYAPHDDPVLLCGESGVGKTQLAKLLHRWSGREGALVVVPPGENRWADLVGWRKGAFTGADRDHRGLFSQASRGTLFLDEIDKLPLADQDRLLQVLDDGVYRRLADDKPQQTEARVIAGTNADLEQRVQEGRFKADLYYRISTLPLVIPPLRERPDEIEGWFHHFAAQSKHQAQLPEAALHRLRAHPWPGNLRELRSIVRQLLLPQPTDVPTLVRAEDLARLLQVRDPLQAVLAQAARCFATHAPERGLTLDDAEGFRHLVLVEAAQLRGVAEAYRSLGQERTVAQGNSQRLFAQSKAKAEALLERLLTDTPHPLPPGTPPPSGPSLPPAPGPRW